MKAVLLVGGLGTRLRSAVPSLPKALASVGGRPFLELLVRQLACQGLRQLVMCTGYLSEQIEEVFRDGIDFGGTIEYSKETVPLGTAGALKLAQRYLQQESEFLVLNGDSFVEVDFNDLIDFHSKHSSLATIAVVAVENASRYGTVHVGAASRVLGFAEKSCQDAPGIINAGVYVFSNSILAQIPDGPASLERDVFPQLLEQGVYAVEHRGIFIDIGTPDDYVRASEMYGRLATAALDKRCRISPIAIS
ncbi:nucleotidyltransferase family protein [Tunturibacter psychrotolerans]|uniref:Nucleotidyltransferase family protein n=1 Tax=Tunturiibacter psychrotolerans TaxID=3069686 RepID=A0AAU7ZNE8_9BACT